MGYSTAIDKLAPSSCFTDESSQTSPRLAMYHRLPRVIQPFLTWLTAQPMPGETVKERSPLVFVGFACAQVFFGLTVGILGTRYQPALVLAGMLLVTAGLGLFQVVIFHHCSHGTVFGSRASNLLVGRLISVVLLFKHFDSYKHEHMLHHSHNKLLTEEDEFADFVFHTCRLKAGEPINALRRRVLLHLISPIFHAGFTIRRMQAAWGSPRHIDTGVGVAFWAITTLLAVATGHGLAFLLVWVCPVTVLLQIATVGRILCEHSFPELEIIRGRGRDLATHATGGVFAGSMPPATPASSLSGLTEWALWWASMLGVQLLVRLVILVGDAPCHDFHHRKPASRRWTSYIHARQSDRAAASALLKAEYRETWGLFRAIDATLISLSRLPPGTEI